MVLGSLSQVGAAGNAPLLCFARVDAVGRSKYAAQLLCRSELARERVRLGRFASRARSYKCCGTQLWGEPVVLGFAALCANLQEPAPVGANSFAKQDAVLPR
ncbi:hypothetical protein Pres01_39450 [Metapseudomonas resinovorans]|nr:hypothetical protein Pres01_39450 [Pseudomonas resinovorans]